MRRTVLVTGGAGFIGHHLVRALRARGDRVIVLDDLSSGTIKNIPDDVTFIEDDVLNIGAHLHALKDCSGIFHLAAIASVERCQQEWIGSHKVNQTGTIAVLDAGRSLGRIPVVYASSAAIYGDQGDGPIVESAMPRPISAYGADKLGSELHAQVAASLYGVPNVGLRFFNVYGPGQSADSPYSGVISIFANRARQGLPITIHGNGAQIRDFVYVDDVVEHLIQAMYLTVQGTLQHGVFNVCSGVACSISDLAGMIVTIAESQSEISYGPTRSGDIRSSLGSYDIALADLGKRAEIDLDIGLRRTLAHHDAK